MRMSLQTLNPLFGLPASYVERDTLRYVSATRIAAMLLLRFAGHVSIAEFFNIILAPGTRYDHSWNTNQFCVTPGTFRAWVSNVTHYPKYTILCKPKNMHWKELWLWFCWTITTCNTWQPLDIVCKNIWNTDTDCAAWILTITHHSQLVYSDDVLISMSSSHSSASPRNRCTVGTNSEKEEYAGGVLSYDILPFNVSVSSYMWLSPECPAGCIWPVKTRHRISQYYDGVWDTVFMPWNWVNK